MPYEIQMGGHVIATMGMDGKVNYTSDGKDKIQEIIAGKPNAGGGSGGGYFTSVKVVYRFDNNRLENNDAIFRLWKRNPILQNRITQFNSLIFGRGFAYSYPDKIKEVIDRFWRVNRIKQKLSSMSTDAQLYGEVFIGLFPQSSGDVLMAVYESNQVEIDFSPANVDDINQYLVGYKDEESGRDEILKFKPVYKYLNEMELSSSGGLIGKVKKMVGGSKAGLGGFDGAMIHIKFNHSSTEVHGASDFRQVYQPINDYMDFRGDRLTVHQLYGSPVYDIEIDTDDPTVIQNRIEELAGFTIGSNPVHNAKEKWSPLEFRHATDSSEFDERAMRGLICAGTSFPEYLLFNQSHGRELNDGTFALNKLAEDRQDAFGDAFVEMHKFVASIAGADILEVDKGQIIFPEISTMSEKAKAETYVLKVGAKIVSRKTAALNTGHNWDIEEAQILEEMELLGIDGSDLAGRMGGRFSNKVNNQDPNRDDGTADRKARAQARNVTTQVMGSRKTNN